MNYNNTYWSSDTMTIHITKSGLNKMFQLISIGWDKCFPTNCTLYRSEDELEELILKNNLIPSTVKEFDELKLVTKMKQYEQ